MAKEYVLRFFNIIHERIKVQNSTIIGKKNKPIKIFYHATLCLNYQFKCEA